TGGAQAVPRDGDDAGLLQQVGGEAQGGQARRRRQPDVEGGLGGCKVVTQLFQASHQEIPTLLEDGAVLLNADLVRIQGGDARQLDGVKDPGVDIALDL